ncbi:MAG: uracil-DNA glycosylase [Candidatus Hydrogenedentes bacterium]|nr:uracil-DNA glycosylase [Candidatus Hydrogenedentota bacterium]
MFGTEPYKEIVAETCNLLRETARRGRKTVPLSPEVAASLGKIQTVKATKQQLLDALEQEVRACKTCTLAGTRTNVVFGSGNANAKLVFVGEAPGRDEDLQGKPFVGRAGQLLTDIIEKGMKLRREDVYICNVLKCRPPENRNPLPAEIAHCEPFLIRQLEIIKPKVICALGTFAAQTLLKTTEPIGRLRGKWYFYHGIPLRATYHPAYLLRNQADKRKAWMDVLEVLKVYNGEIHPKPDE